MILSCRKERKILFLMREMKFFIVRPLSGKLQLSICCTRIRFDLVVVSWKRDVKIMDILCCLFLINMS